MIDKDCNMIIYDDLELGDVLLVAWRCDDVTQVQRGAYKGLFRLRSDGGWCIKLQAVYRVGEAVDTQVIYIRTKNIESIERLEVAT